MAVKAEILVDKEKSMILDRKTEEKPKIDYPTKWGFKVIGRDKLKLEDIIKDILKDKEHSCKFSNVSKSGKFTSFNAECIVESQEERDAIYKAFNEHNDIDYVI